MGPIQTKDANGVISGTVAEPLKGYVPANPRGPRGTTKPAALTGDAAIIAADVAEWAAEAQEAARIEAQRLTAAEFKAAVDAAVAVKLAALQPVVSANGTRSK